ncbi:MAG: AAA family ATPase, partial [Acidobacteriota bacterium]|nr:AAA family ATPase [Acidobacteriota bacterium]
FTGVRVALQDSDARIRIEENIPQSFPYVMGMSLEGNFLDDQVIHFSRNLNCIIGGRGAGKSTAFEAIRCLSHTPSESKLVDSEVWPENIHLVWVERGGQQHIIRRRINDAAENLSCPEVGAVFQIESYGQNETAQTSVKAQDDPGALLQYMDRFVDTGDLQNKDEEIRSALLENQTDIEKAQNKVGQIPEYRKLLARVQQQLKALDTAHATKVVALERKIAEERSVREGIEKQLVELANQLRDTSVTSTLAAIESLSKVVDLKVGQTEFEEIVSLARTFQKIAKTSKSKLATDATEFSVQVRERLASWKEREQKYLTLIDERRQALLAQGIRLDLPYIKKLARDESSYKETLKTLSTWETHLKQLRKQRYSLLSERSKIRSKIFSSRAAYAARANQALKDALEDLTVSVKFVESGLSGEAENIIQQAMSWRTSQVPRCALLVEQVTVPSLLDAIRKTDTKAVTKVTSADGLKPFNKSDAQALLAVLAQQQTLFRLQRCHVEDRPKITVTKKVEKPGKSPRFISRDFAKLSLGQQQSVLLALMLSSDSDAPLIIDQPEDNLDSEFIFHSLVPVIRAAKERRQVIVVTHNANIAVLGDAEQIVALKSTSDRSVIVSAGSIDDSKTKTVVCRILEGAEEAFRRRAKMYNMI